MSNFSTKVNAEFAEFAQPNCPAMRGPYSHREDPPGDPWPTFRWFLVVNAGHIFATMDRLRCQVDRCEKPSANGGLMTRTGSRANLMLSFGDRRFLGVWSHRTKTRTIEIMVD